MKNFIKIGDHSGLMVFKNNHRDFVWTGSLLRVKALLSLGTSSAVTDITKFMLSEMGKGYPLLSNKRQNSLQKDFLYMRKMK